MSACDYTTDIPDEITARFHIVTPMFIGGGDQLPDGIRPPSFKGALRFWWRALNWGRFIANEENIPGARKNALRKLHARECQLFGSAADDNGGGQGIFLLRVKASPVCVQTPEAKRFGGEAYLRGMGLAHRARCYPEGGQFDVNIRFRRHGDSASRDRAEIVDALVTFGLLGGLGSRTRRGCGSIALDSIPAVGWQAPDTLEAYKAAVGKLIGQAAVHEVRPPFSAFIKDTRAWVKTGLGKSGRDALEKVGAQLIRFRSNGRTVQGGCKILNQLIRGDRKDLRFWGDHDLMLDAASGRKITTLPRRLVFGLPHNYQYSSGVRVSLQKTNQGRERRASPLMLHIHRVAGEAVCVQLFMFADFLPAGETIQPRGSDRIEVKVDWKALVEWAEESGFRSGGRIHG